MREQCEELDRGCFNTVNGRGLCVSARVAPPCGRRRCAAARPSAPRVPGARREAMRRPRRASSRGSPRAPARIASPIVDLRGRVARAARVARRHGSVLVGRRRRADVHERFRGGMRRGRRRRGRAVHRHRAPHDAHLRSQGRLQRPALRHRIGDGHRRGDRPGSRKRRRGVVRRHRHRTRRDHTAARRRRRRGVLVPPVILGRGCEIIEAPARPRRTLRPLARHDEHPGLRRQHGLIRRRVTRRRPRTEAAREGGGHARDGGAAHRVRRRGMRVVFVRSVAVVRGVRVPDLHRANERGSWRTTRGWRSCPRRVPRRYSYRRRRRR